MQPYRSATSCYRGLIGVVTTITVLGLSACGGGGGGGVAADVDDDTTPTPSYTVSAIAGTGGSISPASIDVDLGATTSVTVSTESGYSIVGVTGCDGTLSGNTYTTGAITEDCTVEASFSLNSYTVSATAGTGGSISPASASVNHGATTSIIVTPDSLYTITGVTGCDGTLNGSNYTTGVVTADCTVTASFKLLPPSVPSLSLTPQSIKTFSFSWADVAGETEYRLLENPDGTSGYTQIATLAADTTNHALEVFLPARINARYMLQACNSEGCVDSAPVLISGNLAEAVGYVKASNTDAYDGFGNKIAFSADGSTLAVGAFGEDSNAVDGEQDDNLASSGAVYVFSRSITGWSQQAYLKAATPQANDNFGTSVTLSADGNTLAVGALDTVASGAVYVFSRSGTTWSQQAYVKASNTADNDFFGAASSVTLSADGNTLAVGAYGEDSKATGINGDEADNSLSASGAVYVFTRSGTTWSQQAYLKASNTGAGDNFGYSVALAADGNTLAVGAYGEDSDGDPANDLATRSGAVYVFIRSGTSWDQQAYLKASRIDADNQFGNSVALAADGNTLAVAAYTEDSGATGIDGDETDTTAPKSGAVYVFSRSGTVWSQQAYVKASNTGANDSFGISVALSTDGNTLAVGAYYEDSKASGIGGDEADDSVTNSGAAYLFRRSDTVWSQQAYVKASNTSSESDYFGYRVALTGDGKTLAVGAYFEDSAATDIGGDQTDITAANSGAVYLY